MSDFAHTDEWKEHRRKGEILERIILGDDELGEKGMKAKVDEMHSLLVQAQNVGGFFGSIGGIGRWIFVVAGMVAIFKLWGAALLAWLTLK